MKFHLPAKTLRQALDRMTGLPGKSPTSDGVRIVTDEFEGLLLTRMTPEGWMQITCPAMVSGESTAIVNFETLRSLAQRGAEELSFQVTKEKLLCQTGNSKSSLKLWSPEEWPTRELETPIGPSFTLKSADFLRWVKAAGRAQYKGEERKALAGVCLRQMDDFLTILAGDGRRFHILFGPKFEDRLDGGFEGAYDKGILLSKVMQSCLDQFLDTDDGECCFTVERCLQVTSSAGTCQLSLPTDAPPDIREFAKPRDYDLSFQVKRQELITAVRRALPFTDEHNCVEIFPGPRECRVLGENGVNSDETTIDLANGFEGRLAINGGYLVDMLESLEGETVEIGYYRGNQALCCREPSRVHLVMLVRDEKPLP